MFPATTRILIVDDMPSVRFLVKSSLRVLGFDQIYEASDGLCAYKVLVERSNTDAPIELIISDWNMPKMTGIELLKKVRSHSEWGYLPFVLLTAETERDQVTTAVLEGVSQYIAKPFSAKTFEEKLKDVYVRCRK